MQKLLTTKQLETIHNVLFEKLDMLDAFINDERDDVKKWRDILKHTNNDSERDEVAQIIEEHKQTLKEYQKQYKKIYAVSEALYRLYY